MSCRFARLGCLFSLMLGFGCARQHYSMEAEYTRTGFSPPTLVTAAEVKQLHADFEIPADAFGPALIFASVDTRGEDSTQPDDGDDGDDAHRFQSVILQKTDRGWFIARADLFGFWWNCVASTPDRKHMWAIASYDVEDPDWLLHLFHSADGGRTWTHWAAIEKPFYDSTLSGLEFNADGTGHLTIDVECDAVQPGRYVCTTRDWGRHWNKPVRGYTQPALLLDRSLSAQSEMEKLGTK